MYANTGGRAPPHVFLYSFDYIFAFHTFIQKALNNMNKTKKEIIVMPYDTVKHNENPFETWAAEALAGAWWPGASPGHLGQYEGFPALS